jgi:hypothetical protein
VLSDLSGFATDRLRSFQPTFAGIADKTDELTFEIDDDSYQRLLSCRDELLIR